MDLRLEQVSNTNFNIDDNKSQEEGTMRQVEEGVLLSVSLGKDLVDGMAESV